MKKPLIINIVTALVVFYWVLIFSIKEKATIYNKECLKVAWEGACGTAKWWFYALYLFGGILLFNIRSITAYFKKHVS